MRDDPRLNLIPYGAGALLLGCVGVAFGDFALQWQPVPAGAPFRTALAYVCALLLALGGAATLLPKTAARGALALGAFFGVWTLVLQSPKVLTTPGAIISWNGFAEITAMAMGGSIGWSLLARTARPPVAIEDWLRRAFGACFAVFGVAHFAYADFTADMVPSWIPGRLLWAYATGVGHIAASISLLSGRLMPLATALLTFMLGSFVTLLHLPRVIANPTSHIEWVMLGVSLTLSGAAWIVRASVVRRETSLGRAAGNDQKISTAMT